MARTLRYLRIAFSVVCGILCLLLIALWVRSYWWWDNLNVGARHSIDSVGGQLMVEEEIAFSVPDWMASSTAELLGSYIRWTTFVADGATSRGIGTAIPDWLLVFSTAVLAASPWLPWRFSLRTLLIATTLVAVLLGTIVWMVR